MASVDILNDKYRLDRLIGKGGFGEVYEATDLTLQRRVAVKLIKDANVGKSDMSTRFLKEARLTSQLKHPNTLTIYDFGKYNNQLFLVSELLDAKADPSQCLWDGMWSPLMQAADRGRHPTHCSPLT